jgi:hypothetical protein
LGPSATWRDRSSKAGQATLEVEWRLWDLDPYWSVVLRFQLSGRDVTEVLTPRRIADRESLTGRLSPDDLQSSGVGPYTFEAYSSPQAKGSDPKVRPLAISWAAD